MRPRSLLSSFSLTKSKRIQHSIRGLIIVELTGLHGINRSQTNDNYGPAALSHLLHFSYPEQIFFSAKVIFTYDFLGLAAINLVISFMPE